MNLFLRKLHHYLLLASMGFFFMLFWPLVYYYLRKPKRYNCLIKLRRAWALVSAFCVGIIFRFEFEEDIDWSKTYVICPHHTSNLDTAMISILLKKPNFCFMGKEELLDDMVTGIFFRTVDIPVNRASKMAAFRAFKIAEDRLRNGISLIMFPEGGIADEYPPKVQEFKNGPFRLAIEVRAPVIAVTSLNTWKVMWDDGAKCGSRPGICRIFVHKPIETAHLKTTGADQLRDTVKAIIERKFAEKQS